MEPEMFTDLVIPLLGESSEPHRQWWAQDQIRPDHRHQTHHLINLRL